jgi:hypothetical protein
MKLSKRKVKRAMYECFYDFGAAAGIGVVPEDQAALFLTALESHYPAAAGWWIANYPPGEYDDASVRPEGPVYDMCEEAYEAAAMRVLRLFGLI